MRITIDIDDSGRSSVGAGTTPSDPTTGESGAPQSVLTRAAATGAVSAGPAPSAPQSSAPSRFTDGEPSTTPDSGAAPAAAQSAGAAPSVGIV